MQNRQNYQSSFTRAKADKYFVIKLVFKKKNFFFMYNIVQNDTSTRYPLMNPQRIDYKDVESTGLRMYQKNGKELSKDFSFT